MPLTDFDEVTRILQTSISPVALLSGIGLFLLVVANRYARTTDGVRALVRQMKDAPDGEKKSLGIQTHILFRRSRILRWSILFAGTSIFCSCVLILALFAAYYFRLNLKDGVMFLFSAAFVSLILSVALFIRDVTISLKALQLELKDVLS